MNRWERYRQVEKKRLLDLLEKEGPLSSEAIQRRLNIVQSAVVTRMKWLGRKVRIAGWQEQKMTGGRRTPLYGIRKNGEKDAPEPPPKSKAQVDRDYWKRRRAREEMRARNDAMGPWVGLLRHEGDQALECVL